MVPNMLKRFFFLIVLMIMAADGFCNPTKELVSLLDVNPELKKHFSPDRKARIHFEDSFKENYCNRWPVGKIGSDTIAIKNNRLIADVNGLSEIVLSFTTPLLDKNWSPCDNKWSLPFDPESEDYLIETCFKITKGEISAFGLLLGYTTDMDGHCFLIRRTGEYVHMENSLLPKEYARWRTSDAIRKGSKYNTLSVLKLGDKVQHFINGVKVIGPDHIKLTNQLGFTNRHTLSDWRKNGGGTSSALRAEVASLTVYVAPPRPKDLYIVLLGNTQAPDLTDKQNLILKKVIQANNAGLKKPSQMLFETLVSQAAENMFQHRYTRRIIGENLPIEFAGQVLMAIRENHQNDPAFFIEYSHLAGQAGQPALVLQGVAGLRRTAAGHAHETSLLHHATIFEAMAMMMMEKEEDAYTALFMQFDLKNDTYAMHYINRFAGILKKDKKKLAGSLGGTNTIQGSYKALVEQPFYNLETGQRVNPAASRIDTLKKAKNKPTHTGVSQPKTGVTVLD
ncbi:MAG: hypothetical protein MI799_09310 [Desulfobacterales bacterium]|nr:hypothetical protein [Desulfobacterales bacterium]